MIEIFYGDDRLKIEQAVKARFADDYEVLEGASIELSDLPSILLGGSLFAEQRKILIKDLGENKEVFAKLPEYLNTPHEVILFETKLDKRSAAYKALKDQVKIQEFKLPENVDMNLVFDIFKTAKRDGKKAVEMLEKIETTQDPYMLVGLMASQATRDFEYRPGAKEKRVLKELSKLDMKMKSTSFQPFSLLKSFLLQVSSL